MQVIKFLEKSLPGFKSEESHKMCDQLQVRNDILGPARLSALAYSDNNSPDVSIASAAEARASMDTVDDEITTISTMTEIYLVFVSNKISLQL